MSIVVESKNELKVTKLIIINVIAQKAFQNKTKAKKRNKLA
jgi:hypothetical protein